MTLVAGVDSSTQATKVAVVRVEDGEVVARGRAPHPPRGAGLARETDPQAWWQALGEALEQTQLAGQVAALSVAAQQHGLVLTDDRGDAVRPAILWNDTRSAQVHDELLAAAGGAEAWATRVGSVPPPAFTVSSWVWLRRTEPQAVKRAQAVMLPHDYLTYRLTGRIVTDRGDASGTGWWSTASGSYDEEILGLPLVALSGMSLPTVLGPREAAGPVLEGAAAQLGLSADCTVGPGTGDNMAAALALALEPGEAAISLGTSGTVYTKSTRRPADPTGVVSGFADADGDYLPLACTLNCTQAVDRAASWLGLDREDIAPQTDVVVLPYLDGERTPHLPHASGAAVGLRHDTTRESLLRAVYEGAAASLVEALDTVIAIAGVDEEPAGGAVIVIGGGARGAGWQDVLGTLTGRALLIPDEDELVALGAAVQAAAVLTGEPLMAIARRWDKRRGRELPARPRDDGRLEAVRSAREQIFGVR